MPMQVVIVPHDPAWHGMFLLESGMVMAALHELGIQAHHVGSTAIPGILAKPIIDILVVVADIATVDKRSDQMAALGYEVMGEYGIPMRRYFRKDNAAGIRTHHVHVFAQGNPQIERHVAFRDFLRAHPDWASRYSDLKRELAAKYPDSMDGYIAGKDGFIQCVDRLAAAWRRGVPAPCVDKSPV